MTDYTTPPPPPPTGPPGPGEPYGAPPQQPQNIFGLLSLIFGIVSVVLCCLYAGFWAGIPAVVLGFLGMQKANQGLATNKQFAIIGMALGAVMAVLTVILLIVGTSLNPSDFQN